MITPRPIRHILGFAAPLLALVATASAPAIAAPAEPEAGPAPAGCTGPASQTWLKVITEGVRSAHGTIAITLYADDQSRFLAHHGSMYVTHVQAVSGTTEGCIFVPKPGVYALALYHDENNNGSFDRTGVGLPAEGYGFSNNPSTLFGLPAFSSVRLYVKRSGMTAHITLKYP